jgi:hypothetical protein
VVIRERIRVATVVQLVLLQAFLALSALVIGYAWPRPTWRPALISVQEQVMAVETTQLYPRESLWIVTWVDATGVLREKLVTPLARDRLVGWIESGDMREGH